MPKLNSIRSLNSIVLDKNEFELKMMMSADISFILPLSVFASLALIFSLGIYAKKNLKIKKNHNIHSFSGRMGGGACFLIIMKHLTFIHSTGVQTS